MDVEPDSKSENFDHSSLKELSDKDLLELWMQDNQDAATVLTERYAVRLTALLASRMRQQFRSVEEPEDLAQSALKSFFLAARNQKVRFSQSVSFWNLLAVFARRKLARAIERQMAAKRGGGLNRVPTEPDELPIACPAPESADELLESLRSQIPSELLPTFEPLIAGLSHAEIATQTQVDERTVRRRVSRIRSLLSDEPESPPQVNFKTDALKKFAYNEFVLGKLIGMGGFGKVYRASLQRDGQHVAVKFLRKIFWQNSDAKLEFLKEINLASQVRSPNIVRYLGWGESPHGGPFVVMQWIDGQPLRECRDVPANEFKAYLGQLLDSVAQIHRQGIIHGDISPGNVLVDSTGNTFLTDFGFASTRLNEESLAASLSRRGGTPGFAAPEQVSSSFGSIGPHTDVYAIGGLAYWYLTGRPPHAGDSIEEMLANTIAPFRPTDGLSGDSSIVEIAKTALQQAVNQRPEIKTLQQMLRIEP